MANKLLGPILGAVFGNAMRGRRGGGALGGSAPDGRGASGGLGDLLGGMMGGGRASPRDLPGPAGGLSRGGGGGMLMAMMLPLAMQWVQRNGGLGGVLQRFNQKGYSQQAASWVSTGDNQAIDPQAVGDVVGQEELSRLSQQLGVPQQEVAHGFAELLPEMVNQLTPDGTVPDDADDVLGGGLQEVERALGDSQPH